MTFITAKKTQYNRKWLIFATILIVNTLFIANNIAVGQIPAFEINERIQQSVKIYLEEISNAADNPAIEVKVNNLDSRLKLRLCEKDLKISLPAGSKERGKIMVMVQCEQPVTWKLFVPGIVNEYENVVVAKHSLSRKNIIGHHDVTIKRIKMSSFRKQTIKSLKQVIGSSVKRHVRSGSVLFEDSVCMVCRGDSVQISAKNRFLNINLQGIALSDATIGEVTLVRNQQSKRSFSATVVGRNQLEVLLTVTK